MVYRCRYCGEYALKPDKDNNHADDSDLVYKCTLCGIMCTENEAEMFDSAETGPLNDSELLTDAWNAMQNREWHTALDILNQVQQPLIYPLECLIFSSVCRAAALFQSPQDLLPLRYRQLFILINNIDCIGVYLPNDQDRNFAALQRADAALMLLGSQPVRKHRTTIADQTNYLRANAISAFAEFLKITAQTAPKYRTEYLKMAVRLLLQCLEFSKEYQGLFVTLKEDELNLPTEERLKINAEIEQLNADILMSDPSFIPVQPPPVPKIRKTRYIHIGIIDIMFILGLLINIIVGFGMGILFFILDDLDDGEHNGLASFLGWGFIIWTIVMIVLPFLYHMRNGNIKIFKDFDD